MTPDSSSLQKLVHENQKLRAELAIAQQWIGREVSEIRMRKVKQETMHSTRKSLQEGEDDIRSRIHKYFGGARAFLSEENEDLLVESEINFQHLARKKDLDALMVTNVYQKILENIFEEHMTRHFREKHGRSRLHPSKNDLLEKTLYKVMHDWFHLSIGKIYQIFERMVMGKSGDLIELFRDSIDVLPLSQALNDSESWELFTDLIETKAFGEKRHAGKISFQDARFIRESVTGNYEEEGLLKILFKYLG